MSQLCPREKQKSEKITKQNKTKQNKYKCDCYNRQYAGGAGLNPELMEQERQLAL